MMMIINDDYPGPRVLMGGVSARNLRKVDFPEMCWPGGQIIPTPHICLHTCINDNGIVTQEGQVHQGYQAGRRSAATKQGQKGSAAALRSGRGNEQQDCEVGKASAAGLLSRKGQRSSSSTVKQE